MNGHPFLKEQTGPGVVLRLVQYYLPFWPLFLFTTGLCMAVVALYLRSQPQIYQAAGRVLLKDPNRNGSDSKVLDALNIFGEKKIVENEVVVLRSSGLMREVVKQLRLYATVFNQGRVQTEELYADRAPVSFRALNDKAANFGGKHPFTIDFEKQQLTLSGNEYRFGDTILLAGAAYEIIPNMDYNRTAARRKNFFVLFNGVEKAAGQLVGALTASALSNQSTVIDVKLKTQVPQKGKDVLNSLFKVYNAFAIADKNQTAAKTLAFIESRLALVIRQLDSVETDVKNYKAANDVYNLGEQAQVYLGTIKDLDGQKVQVDLQLNVLEAVAAYVNGKSTSTDAAPSLLLLQDPALVSLLQRFYDAEAVLESSRGVAGEKSDLVLSAAEAFHRLKAAILENMHSLRSSLVTARNHVSQEIHAVNSLLKSIPQKEIGLVTISRQQSIKNSIYTFLLQKREETALNSAATLADLRVIENGTVGGPVSPVSRNYYLGALLLGVCIAAGLIGLREQWNRRLLFRHEIEAATSVPVIAELQQLKNPAAVVIRAGKHTAIAEQFRSLRTHLSFTGLNQNTKTVLVTSSIAGEGKSFTAVNLAISLSLTGRKVVLLELDLRKPRLSRIFGLPRHPGVSSYLAGQAAFSEILQPTTFANVTVIAAGPLPPNPAEQLLSDSLARLMAEVKEHFDYVVIDTVPVAPVADAFLLKDFADATLFVVRHNVTPKVCLTLLNEISQQQKLFNLAIVFNGLKRRGYFAGSSYGSLYYSDRYVSDYGGKSDVSSRRFFPHGAVQRIKKAWLHN